jgi:hypothetical protein
MVWAYAETHASTIADVPRPRSTSRPSCQKFHGLPAGNQPPEIGRV